MLKSWPVRHRQTDIDRHIAAMVQTLNAGGFGVRLHPDAMEYRRFAVSADGHDPASPLDPCFADLPRGSFFWIQVLDGQSRPVAICAARALQAPRWRGGLAGMLRNQSLFSRPAETLIAPMVEVPEANMTGCLGYIGGGWTQPEYRRKGLIGFAVRLAQMHLVKHHRIRHAVGFVREKHLDLALAADGYAFAGALQAFMPYCAGTGFPERLYLVHLSADRIRQRANAVPNYSLKGA